MSFTPVVVIDVILVVITVLLAVADRLLVTYGECTITVHQGEEEDEFTGQGGNYLLSYLQEAGIHVPASCGGKATCGYCKIQVVSGGGPILPTEEIFMSRQEREDNIRLACQVKVREDIEVAIPDFLTTVRNIVENELYDPTLDWKFNIAAKGVGILDGERVKTQLEDENIVKINEILEEYDKRPGALLPILQEVNNTFNYLPEPVLAYLSEKIDIPLSHIYRTATFFNAFDLEPKGEYTITVCLGTACHVKGAGNIIETFEDQLGIERGQTTEDMLFTLKGARCLGTCGLAPVLMINENVYGKMTTKKVPEIIEKYKGKQQ